MVISHASSHVVLNASSGLLAAVEVRTTLAIILDEVLVELQFTEFRCVLWCYFFSSLIRGCWSTHLHVPCN
jgi:hypothetical protein